MIFALHRLFMIASIVLALIAILYLCLKAPRKSLESLHRDYKEKSFLLSPTEQEFFEALQKAVSINEAIFSKVRQADILETNYNKSHPKFWPTFNRISQRHVDFVLCDKKSSRILTVIEINDKSHNKTDRIKRDIELREALKNTSIQLIEIPAAMNYSVEEIKNAIYAKVSYYDDQKPSAIAQKENRDQHVSQFSPRRSIDKYIPVDMDNSRLQKQQEQKVQSTLKKPIASHLEFDPDSRYMPKI